MVVRVTGVVVLVNLLTAVMIADDLIDILVVTVIRMTSVVVVFSVRAAVVVVLRAHSGVDNTHWAGLPLVAEVNVDELGNTSASSPSAIPTYILARGIPPHTLSTETTAPRPLAVAVVFLQLALALHTGFCFGCKDAEIAFLFVVRCEMSLCLPRKYILPRSARERLMVFDSSYLAREG
jgi:hypothetical protein